MKKYILVSLLFLSCNFSKDIIHEDVGYGINSDFTGNGSFVITDVLIDCDEIGLPSGRIIDSNYFQEGTFLVYYDWQKHVHNSVKSFFDPIIYRDTTKIKYNVITYVIKNDSCWVCHKWYQTRQNVDTFSTRRKAKYSNIKYKKS